MILGLWLEERTENRVDFGEPLLVGLVEDVIVGHQAGQFVFGVELGEVHWVLVLSEVDFMEGMLLAFGCEQVFYLF